jgi:hypothetical protein
MSGTGVEEDRMKDIRAMTDKELENTLIDLYGRLELSDDEIELLYELEDEWERRQKNVRNKRTCREDER